MSIYSGPAVRWRAVTPSDDADIVPTPRGLYIGMAGDVALMGDDGNVASFSVDANTVLPLRAVRVMETDTTADGIVALY